MVDSPWSGRGRRPAGRRGVRLGPLDVEVLRRRLPRLVLDVRDGPLQSLVAVSHGFG